MTQPRNRERERVHPPFHFVRTLGNEESLGVCLDLGTPRIYGYFAIHPLLDALNLDGQQQQFQFRETQPNCTAQATGNCNSISVSLNSARAPINIRLGGWLYGLAGWMSDSVVIISCLLFYGM